QFRPWQIATTILQMPGDEAHRLRIVAMGQGNARVGSAATGSSNAGYHLEGYAMGGQLLDFLAATAKDERVTAFEAQYPLAFLGQRYQPLVDLLLRQGVLCASFAHLNTVCIAATQIENGRRYQAVIKHHISLLHQAQGAEGQQVWITRPGADQIDFAQCLGARTGKFFRQQALRLVSTPGQRLFGDIALEYLLPEHAPLLNIGEFRFDLGTEFFCQSGQLPVGGRNPTFNTRAHQPRQHRSVASTGDCNHQWRAVDDGRKDHRAQLRRIHHIDRNAKGAGILRNKGVQGLVIRGSDSQYTTTQIAIGITAKQRLPAALLNQLSQLWINLGCNDAKGRTRLGQQPGLAQSNIAPAYDQHQAAFEVVEQRKVIHAALS